ncbi:2-isopropylmalate synthase [Verrucosispora sp. CWR15]|uniref:2-isopropylmalate synthase n=2 Tax=Micromonosporaceae TaxID=28056 RepID=A0A6M1LAJ1_9ACTN|nr:2-isopropylmalate synthase [Verrucosispora sioxanthis]NGM15207.1 2-isopropylmalate synthase [Verrucosispora sioxanthis]
MNAPRRPHAAAMIKEDIMHSFHNAVKRYRPAVHEPLPDRTWPDRVIAAAPRWLSTDLRDGNQSLVNPMDPARKLSMFRLLVTMGYREIEVGFPSASRDDHDFLRLLIDKDLIPDDVRITVLVQARDDLIRRTVQSLVGAPRATVHLYNATSPLFRRMVLGVDRDGCRQLAVHGTQLMMKYAEESLTDCDLGYQYSPELFNDTEADFSLEVCEAVMDVWQPEPGRPIILNFPTTVERTMPNVFADRIEWMDRHLSRREHLCLSVHPHNDRGTGVATAELAVLAGAERIEGCLFGNGERAGNVDLVTLGLNLFSQGVDPGIDFSGLDRIRRTAERCTDLPVHPRHPYAGDLAYTAFSGSHQDAINKGFAEQSRVAAEQGVPVDEVAWEIPYLPIDPQDVGRAYESVVRINSQSGKGGVAYVLSSRLGLHPPRDLQLEFAGLVQSYADAEGGEIDPERVCALFRDEYVSGSLMVVPVATARPVSAYLHIDGAAFTVGGQRTDELERIGRALARWGVEVRAVHRTGTGLADSTGLVVYAELRVGDETLWGAGIEAELPAAVSAAVRSAVARVGRTPLASVPRQDQAPAVAPRYARVG